MPFGKLLDVWFILISIILYVLIAAPATSNGITPAASAVEMDLLGALSEPFSSNPLALVPAGQPDASSEANPNPGFTSGPTFVGGLPPPATDNQPFDDPFGDGPFRAITSTDGVPTEQQINTSSDSFTVNSNQSLDVPQSAPQKPATEVGGAFYDATNMASSPFGMPPTSATPIPQQESSTTSHEIDILADILPPSAPLSFVNTQSGYQSAPNQSLPHNEFPPQTNQPTMQPSLTGQYATQNGFQAQPGQPGGFPPSQLGQPSMQANYPPQPAHSAPQAGFPSQTMALALPGQAAQAPHSGFHPQGGSMLPNQPNMNFYGAYHHQSVAAAPAGGYMVPPTSTGVATNQNFLSHMGSQAPQAQSSTLVAPVSVTQASTGSSAVAPKPDKFETKSTVWADTLSRGLVNLNISGSKTNPLADIGVDFDAINRKEKRMEKQPATTTVASTVTMGKAMGSGSGVGRAGAGTLRPQPNPMMGSGMNFNMASGPGGGMGMGGYGGGQPIGRGMGMGMGPGVGMNMPGPMGMGMGMNMGMGPGMNTGIGPGMNMQQPMGHPPGSNVPGGYNPTMGPGNYSQHPYGGYR